VRRFFRFILLGAVFLGGYHLGRKPGSPDVVGQAQRACGRVVHTANRVSARAKAENTTLTKAAISCLLDGGACQADPAGDGADQGFAAPSCP